jgi:LPS sulfotransferase NodH
MTRLGFVCLYYGGTGSSWLLNTLETSPEVLVPAYEPLEWMHWQADDADKLAWVDTVLDPPDSGDAEAVETWKQRLRSSPQFVDFGPKPFRVVGFKMSPEAVADVAGLIDVIARRGAKLLAIRRRDRVRHALSLYRAHVEGKHQFRGEGLLPPTKLKRRPFLEWLDYSERVDRHMAAILGEAAGVLAAGDVLVVDYEDFLADEGKEATVAAAAEFLGVTDRSSMRWSTYRKATPDALEDAVENYAALQRWLRRR